MLVIRRVYPPCLPLLPLLFSSSSQIRRNSKITHKDNKRNSRKEKHSPEDKAFINLANEGRKLSEYCILDDFNPNQILETESPRHSFGKNSGSQSGTLGVGEDLKTRSGSHLSGMGPKTHSERGPARSNFNRKGLEEDFDKMDFLHKKGPKQPFIKPDPRDNLEKLRRGECIQFFSLLKRDTTPLFSHKNRSQLFLKPTSSTVPAPAPERETPFERELEESTKFLNTLLYSNPFTEKKEDPYDMNYPVNNEDGQPAEKGVSFKDHVILDHLYEGFPQTGDIRNFIELVVTGLSQNAYLTPQEKKEHVDWFRGELETLSADDLKRMGSYLTPIKVRKRRLKKKV